MARWREKAPALTFSDMPKHLQDLSLDASPALKQEQAEWLERHNLSFLDFVEWRMSRRRSGRRGPPSRRKFMSAEQLRAFDAEREREGEPRW